MDTPRLENKQSTYLETSQNKESRLTRNELNVCIAEKEKEIVEVKKMLQEGFNNLPLSSGERDRLLQKLASKMQDLEGLQQVKLREEYLPSLNALGQEVMEVSQKDITPHAKIELDNIQSNNEILLKKASGSVVKLDEEKDMSYIEMAEGVPYGSLSNNKNNSKTDSAIIKDNNIVEFTVEPTEGYTIIKQGDQIKDFSEKKKIWLDSRVNEVQKTILKPNQGDKKVDLDKMEKDTQVAVVTQTEATVARLDKEAKEKKRKEEWKITGPIENWGEDEGFIRPVNEDVIPIKELVGDLSKTEILADGTSSTVEKKRKMIKEEHNDQVELWENNIEITQFAIENAGKIFQNNKEKSNKNLEVMGLTQIDKGLEAFKNISSKKKYLLGVTFSEYSVATGGIMSFIFTALYPISSPASDMDRMIVEMGEIIWLRSLEKMLFTLDEQTRTEVISLLNHNELDKAIACMDTKNIDVEMILVEVSTSIMSEVIGVSEK